MTELPQVRLRPPFILASGLVIFAAAFCLRLEAQDFYTQGAHIVGTPGTENNTTYTDTYRVAACVDAARAGLVLGAALCGMAAAAWLFVPLYRSAPVVTAQTEEAFRPALGQSAPVSSRWSASQ